MVQKTLRKKKYSKRYSKKNATTRRKLRRSASSPKSNKHTQQYLTLDNGGKPYCVTITGKSGNQSVSVKTMPQKVRDEIDDNWEHPYHMMNYSQQCEYYTKLIKEYKGVKKVHIGKSSGWEYVKGADHPASHKVKFDGNSLLLELGNHKVVFIGHEVFEFTIDDDEIIQAYYSVVGHSAVPYPIVRGKKYVYCMLSKEYLPRDIFPSGMSKYDWEDGYGYFHGFYDTVDKKLVKQSLKKLRSLKIIHSK